ncbi:MAG TPA: hypothetical protein VLM37_05915 [Fibrobacteraceae bacterium]|nr:hypothetical protein [Fibrobacteraceae bacterium]
MKTALLLSLATVAIAQETAPASLSEVAVTHWTSDKPGLLFRDYDLPGGKSEFVWGTSIAGSPDLLLPRLGLYQPIARLPEMASGLYSGGLAWAPWTLGLNGENGILRDTSGLTSPTDTPHVVLDWQRGAFTSNNLHLDFTRAIVGHIFLDLGLVTHSTDSSGDYRYQDITHQPYLGTLKRDSSDVPLSGRNLAFSTFQMHPKIIWFFPRGSLSFNVSWLRLHNDDATYDAPFEDSTDAYSKTFNEDPFSVRTRATGVGGAFQYRFSPAINFELRHQATTLENEWEDTPTEIVSITERDTLIPADTLSTGQITSAYHDTVIDTVTSNSDFSEKTSIQAGEARIGLPRLHASLVTQYESRYYSQAIWEDREIVYGQFQDTAQLGDLRIRLRGQAGAQRNSSAFDSVEYAPAASLLMDADLGHRLRWEVDLRRHQHFPDFEQTCLFRSGRLSYPNADLQSETRRQVQTVLTWHTPSFAYGFGVKKEVLNNAIRQGWMVYPTDTLLDATVAYQWVNIDELDNLSWRCFGGFHIGNWDFWAERESSVHRKMILSDGTVTRTIPDSPTRTYKGTVAWAKRLVDGRMLVNVRWDFQWTGERYDFALDEDGNAIRERLPQNLVLNFEARMRIKSFALYTRIDNLNHTELTPAAGYTPPGVNFRYGIQWELRG